jgi:hypothetical protein
LLTSRNSDTTNVWPNPEESRADDAFNAWAEKEWTEHRRGPLSMTTGNTAALIPLTVISPEGYKAIVNTYKTQKPGEYLPTSYSPEQIAGYEKQRALLASSMGRDDNAIVEYPLSAQGSGILLLTKEVRSQSDVWLPLARPVEEQREDTNS